MGSTGTHCGLGLSHCEEEKGFNQTEGLDDTSRGKCASQTGKGTSQGKEVSICVEFGGHQLAGAAGWC